MAAEAAEKGVSEGCNDIKNEYWISELPTFFLTLNDEFETTMV